MTITRNDHISEAGNKQLDALEELAEQYGDGELNVSEFRNHLILLLGKIEDEEAIQLIAKPFWNGFRVVEAEHLG